MGLGTKLVAGGLIGGALATVLGSPASADAALDIQILQTASSLERLAINTYGAALALPFIADGNATVVAFAETTRMQHDEHRKGFQALTETMGGPVQDFPNPVFQQVVNEAVPTLTGPLEVVVLAAALEKVATDTYLMDLQLFEDKTAMALMGSVMGVEAQHLAVLRAVQALLEAELPDLIAIPTDLAALPAAAGSASFPEPATSEAMMAETTAAAAGGGDVAIAQLAAGLEVLAVSTYQGALDAAGAGALGEVPPAVAEYVDRVVASPVSPRVVEQSDHRQRWRGGHRAERHTCAGCRREVRCVTDVAGAAMLALELETIAAHTYLSAIPLLESPENIGLAGSLQIIDQQHQSVLLFALGQYPVPEVFQTTDKAAA